MFPQKSLIKTGVQRIPPEKTGSDWKSPGSPGFPPENPDFVNLGFISKNKSSKT